MEAAGNVRGTLGQLGVGRHAPGGGRRGHATQRGGAPQGVLAPAGRVEFTGGALRTSGDIIETLISQFYTPPPALQPGRP